MSDRHGVGLVGLGQISAPHLAGYAGAADRIEVVAVCDTDAARAQSVARRARRTGVHGPRRPPRRRPRRLGRSRAAAPRPLPGRPRGARGGQARARREAAVAHVGRVPRADRAGRGRGPLARGGREHALRGGLPGGRAARARRRDRRAPARAHADLGQRGAPPQRSDAVEGPPGRIWRRGDHRRRPALVLPASLARRRARHGARRSTTGSCPRARWTTTRWSPGASPRVRSTPPSTRSPPRSRGASGSSSTGARGRSSSTSCRTRPRCTTAAETISPATPLDGVAFDPRGWKGASIAAGVVDFADSVREGRPPTVSRLRRAARRRSSPSARTRRRPQGGIELEIDEGGTSG